MQTHISMQHLKTVKCKHKNHTTKSPSIDLPRGRILWHMKWQTAVWDGAGEKKHQRVGLSAELLRMSKLLGATAEWLCSASFTLLFYFRALAHRTVADIGNFGSCGIGENTFRSYEADEF